MANKKYVSLSKLSTFLDNLKDTFSSITHKHTTADITDYKVDSELSSASSNPVANSTLNEEFEAIATAMNALDASIDDKANATHNHTVSEVTDLQTVLDNKSDIEHAHSYNDLEDKPFYETDADYYSMFTNGESTVNFYNWGSKVYGAAITGISNGFVVGQTYKVFWDSTEYSLTATYSGDNDAGNPINSVGAAYGDYSTYPFGIDTYITSFGTYEFSVHTNSKDSTHTLDVLEYGEQVITLDEKYIPTVSVPHGGTGLGSVTEGNFLVGNGAEPMVEMTPEDVLLYINGTSVAPMTTAEYEALEISGSTNANTLYMLTDSEDEYYTKLEVDEILDDKANVVHTHDIEEINELQGTLDAIDESISEKSKVQMITADSSEFLSTLNIHRVTQEEYDQIVESGTVENNALYLTPYEDIDLSGYVTKDDLATKADKEHTHTVSDVENLEVLLDEKVPLSRTVNGKALSSDVSLSASDVGAADSDHNHDDMYYTESEVDEKISVLNTSIENITSGEIKVSEATHSETADEATHATSADTATSATKATQDRDGNEISSTYETKTDAIAKLDEAKVYADTVKSSLLNGAGDGYDTLKELGDLIDANANAIKALEESSSGMASSNHNHDNLYYTEAEVDTLISGVNTSIENITNGSTTVAEAAHSESADEATHATNADEATHAVSADSATSANTLTTARTITFTGDASGSVSFDGSEDVTLTVVVEDDSHNHIISNVDGLQTALDNKANSEHNHDDAYDILGSANTALASAKTYSDSNLATAKSYSDTNLATAKSYADTVASNAANTVKNDLLNGAGEAYDTLKELGDLISENVDAIEALESVAAGKADANHNHNDIYYTKDEIDTVLEGKVSSSHTHDDLYYTETEVDEKISNINTTISNIVDGTTVVEKANNATSAEKDASGNVITETYETKTDVETKLDEAKTYVDNALAGKASSEHNHDDIYYTESEVDSKLADKADATHVHTISDITNLQTTLDEKASLSHAHAVSDISDLTVDATELNYLDGVASNVQTQLDNKADSEHNHDNDYDAIGSANEALESAKLYTDDEVSQKSEVQMITTEGENFLPTLKIHRLTQEEYEQKVENGTVEENAIYLTPYEEINLDEYATIEQLNTKADWEHTHIVSDVENLEVLLDEKVPISRTINNKALSEDIVLSASDVGAADVSHNHNELYYTKTEADTVISNINTSISNIIGGTTVVAKAINADKATHAESADSATSATKASQDASGNAITETYETKTDATAKLNEAKGYVDTELEAAKTYVDNALADKADTTHNHDGLYYTETEVDELITSHNHDSLYDSIGSANTALESAKTYTDNAVAQKSLVQICKWEADD